MPRPSMRREVVLGDMLELVECMRHQARRWIAHAKPGAERERVIGAIAMLRVASSAAAALAARDLIDTDNDKRVAVLWAIVRLAVARTGGLDGKEAQA